MNVKFNLKPNFTEKRLFNDFAKKISKDMQTSLNLISANIKTALLPVLKQAIEESDIYYALILGGSKGKNLRAELGFSYDLMGVEEIDEIVDGIISSIKVTAPNVVVDSKGPRGIVYIQAIKRDLEEAMKLPQSVIESKGGPVRWLEWLSFKGDSIIIGGYSILYGIFKPHQSRSGEAIMVPSSKFWRMPPEYAGTASDNWITRAVDNGNDNINQVIVNTINKVLK